MALLHPLFTVLLFLGTTSARAYSVPYQGMHLSFPTASRLIYATSDTAHGGYSYATQDLNGDGSNVVFATGVDSTRTLKAEMNSIREAGATRDMPEGYPESLERQSTTEEIESRASERDDLESNAGISSEMKKLAKTIEENNGLKHRATLRRVPLMHASYPAFRANLPNLQLPPTLSEYYPDYYLPNAIHYEESYPCNSHSRLLPFHSFNFYNPNVPLFYQAPVAIPALGYTNAEDTKMPGESIITKNSSATESNSLKSNVAESRSNLESMISKIRKLSASESAINKSTSEEVKSETTSSESITSKRVEEEITTNESITFEETGVQITTNESTSAAIKSENSDKHTTEHESNSTDHLLGTNLSMKELNNEMPAASTSKI